MNVSNRLSGTNELLIARASAESHFRSRTRRRMIHAPPTKLANPRTMCSKVSAQVLTSAAQVLIHSIVTVRSLARLNSPQCAGSIRQSNSSGGIRKTVEPTVKRRLVHLHVFAAKPLHLLISERRVCFFFLYLFYKWLDN